MGKITFSVVITVLNEEGTISELLDTLINQSEVPGEIVVVDGGSTDKTVDVIAKKAKDSKLEIKCLIKSGFNRSKARNEGIRQAKHDYIAVTDAGCEADKDWLLYLQRGFSNQIEAVGGFYLPRVDSSLQRVFSRFTCTSPAAFNAMTFLPSSRSLAFTKQIWTEVGGYPEHLETCEDLVFAKRLFDTGRLISTDKAFVYWQQPKGFGAYFRQIAGYARGDVEANYWPHVLRIMSVWLRYALFLVFPALFFVYVVYVLIKLSADIHKIDDVAIVLLGQLVADLGVISGSIWGVMERFKP